MFDVEKKLKAIAEGAVELPMQESTHKTTSSKEILEEAFFAMFESSIKDTALFESASIMESSQFVQYLSEADATDPGTFNIIFKRIRDHLRGFVPSDAVNDLEVVREKVINKWLTLGMIGTWVFSPIFGLIYLIRRILKIRNMTAEQAKKAISEAEKTKDSLEKLAEKIYSQAKTQADRGKADKIKAQVREIEIAIGQFKDKYSITLGKQK